MKKTTTTKTKSQRIFAMAMAAAMVVSMAPVTALAEESAPAGDNGGTSQEASGQNASGNAPTVTITVTKSDDGSETKETKSESTNEAGASVTETTTETTEADGTKTERTETTTASETTEENDRGGETTTVESDTEYKETTTEPTQTEPKTDGGDDGEGSEGTEPAEGGEGSEENKPAEGNTETGYVEGSAASQFEEGKTTDVTTETEGYESSGHTTVTDDKGRVVEEYGYSNGSETTTETETVTDKYIEDRDELEKDDYIEGEEKTLVDDKGEFNNDGSVDTETTSTPIDPGYAGDITITLKPGGTDNESAEVDEKELYEVLLADDRPESSVVEGEETSEDVTDDAGNVIGTKKTKEDVKTDVKDVTNKNGDVVGYETTTTTTTTVVTETKANDTNPIDPTVETGDPVTTTSEPVETIDLPERPAASEVKDEATGKTTITTVEDIVDDDGNVVGYSVSTVTKNAAGDEIAWGGEYIWGKKTVTVTTTETLETTTTKTEYITTTTTTTDITEGKTVNGAWIESTPRIVTGEMSEVAEGTGHGSQTMTSLPTDVRALIDNFENNDLREDPTDKEANNTTDGMIQYIGHAVDSDYQIYRFNGSKLGNLDNAIYILMDDVGNTFYGYCVDLATGADRGAVYEIGNIEDQSYYQGSSIADAEAHIRAIALNGFWGTASGTGSITEIRNMLMKDHGWSAERAATLTEGQALTATQAAIWNYGNNDGNRYVHADVVRAKYGETITAEEIKNIQDLYAALLSKTAPADRPTNILDVSDIIGSQITVGEKAEDARNNDNNADNDVFNAGVSFTVAIVPTANDQLTVVVTQGNTEVGRMALTAANGTQDGKGNTTYTMNNLQLQENLSINLSLDGTQHLKQGVYLYTATVNGVPSYTASQTFVGVGEGSHSVALDVSMTFDVTDETATRNSSSGSNSRSRQDKKVTQTTDTEINEEVVALMEITTVTVTEHGTEWGEEYREEFKYNDNTNKKEEEKDEENKDDGDEYTEEYIIDDGDVPLEELPEVDIPLADIILDDVPKTNDASALWLALSGFSGIGLAGLFGRKRRK